MFKRFQLSSAIPSISCSFDYIHIPCSGEKFAREPWCFELGRARDGIGYALAIQQKTIYLQNAGVKWQMQVCGFDYLVVSAETDPLSEGAELFGET